MTKWLRVGNFYLYNPQPGYSPVNKVSFRNFTHSALIREIYILNFPEQAQIILEGTGFCQRELEYAIRQFFMTCEYSIPQGYSLGFIFVLRSYEQKEKFTKLLSYLNRKYDFIAFPKELISEIDMVFDYLWDRPRVTFKHIIPEQRTLYTHTNPSKKDSTELAHFMLFSLGNVSFDMKKYRKLLVSGEDPHQSFKGHNPLNMARHFENKDVLKLLIFYGANILLPDQDDHLSALQQTKKYEEVENLSIMLSSLNLLEKSLKSSQNKLKVVNTKLFAMSPSEVVTLFQFSNYEWIETKIVPSKNLDNKDKEDLFQIFRKYFESTKGDETHLRKYLFQEFAEDDKYIEMIKHRGRIIGFNFYETISPQRHKDYIILHVVYALILPEYRSMSIEYFLAWRLAYSLQLICENIKVGVFFCAVHYNSIRLIQYKDDDGRTDFYLHYPQHQPGHMQVLMMDLLDTIFAGNYTLFCEEMTCYVLDQVRVKQPYSSRQADFYRDAFYKYILNIDDIHHGIKSEDVKAAPILYMIGDENTLNMTRLGFSLGINFEDHIKVLTSCAAPLLKRALSKSAILGTEVLWRSSNEVFWGVARAKM